MDRKNKEKLKASFVTKFQETNAAILAEFRGMNVGELTILRQELRKSGAEFTVIKNRVAKKAAAEVPAITPLADDLKGPSGLIFMKGDVAAATKIAINYQKENPNFVLKAGVFEGSRLSLEQLKALADLPSREVLLAQIIGSLVAPHRGLVTVMSGVTRQLVQVISAIKDQKKS